MENQQLVTLDLSRFAPAAEIVELDMKQFLFHEFVLKEDHFRTTIDSFNWSVFDRKVVAVFCSNDAIIPSWAYMLVFSEAAVHGITVYSGSRQAVYERLFLENLQTLDLEPYRNLRVLVKGCSTPEVPVSAFATVAAKLTGVAKRVMYGESCSFVPVYRKSAAGTPSIGELNSVG